jgi:hypothetical protein
MSIKIITLLLVIAPSVSAQENPPTDESCLSKEQKDRVVQALKELNDIHDSKAEVQVLDEIIIIRDWEDRVYINGGEKKPIRMKLKLGETVERDMEITLPVHVSYREKPPDPMFRLRIRAQAGVLIPELVQNIKGDSDLKNDPFWDAGIGWDFFHISDVNLSAYTGVHSLGAGLGLDLTRNFGPYIGYALKYRDLHSSILAGVYFSFN